MKIAIWHNLPSGGAKRALYSHIKGLVQRGHTVESWCPSTADQSYLPLKSLIHEHILLLDWKTISVSESSLADKIRWTIFARSHNIKNMEQHCCLCAEEINRGNFDILYAHSGTFIAVAPIAKYVTKPKILYLQEPTRPLYEAMPKWPWIPPDLPTAFWKKPSAFIDYVTEIVRINYYEKLAKEEWINIRAYDAVLANSLYSRESMLRAYGINPRVCYLGVDTDIFKDHDKQRENFIVGVGSFTPSKNIEFVIKALALVRNPSLRLIWVGNQSFKTYLDELKKLARTLNVDFEPKEMVSDDEMVDIYNRAVMMAYAPRLEPFGYTPLEANACGLPVVAVAEGGVRETIVDGVNGLLVEPDEKSMAKAIEQLRDDREYARTLGRNGQKIINEKWSLDASIDRIERRLEQTIGNNKQ